MLPNYFQFYCPVKILSGKLAVSNIPYELRLLGCKRPMLITDIGVIEAGLIDIVKAAFEDCASEITCIFSEVPPDSETGIVKKAVNLFNTKNCDCFIALGGGSVMDTAKCVNMVVSEDRDLMSLQGLDKITKDLKPVIAVPTTAGTGSEATRVAVIYDQDTQTKMAFVSDKLFVDIAVIDPEMTLTLPPKSTAATGIDALTHAIEAFTGLQKNPVSDAFALSTIELIVKYLLKAVQKPKDVDARMAMANASLLAGISFSNSMVGLVHALAHALGGVCRIPHGVANGVILPWALETNIKKDTGQITNIAKLAPFLGDLQIYNNEIKQASASIFKIRELLVKLNNFTGLPLRLSDLGIEKEILPEVALSALNDGALIYNPGDISYDDILAILKKAL